MLEDQNAFSEMARDRKYVAKFDIKSCYCQIPMLKNSRKYLGFKWTINGVIWYVQFKVLPFRLTSGSFICKKLFKLLVNKLRQAGIKLVLFFDDGALFYRSFQIGNEHSQTIKNLLKAHILPNMQKSEWFPKTSCTLSAFFWNLDNATVSVSSERVRKYLTNYINSKRSLVWQQKWLLQLSDLWCQWNWTLVTRAVFLTWFLQT